MSEAEEVLVTGKQGESQQGGQTTGSPILGESKASSDQGVDSRSDPGAVSYHRKG